MRFTKILNSTALTIFAKSSIIDLWQGSKYTSAGFTSVGVVSKPYKHLVTWSLITTVVVLTRAAIKRFGQSYNSSGPCLGFEWNFRFFANALFWASTDNLGLKRPLIFYKWVAFAARVQEKQKRCRARKVAKGP